jgi:UDP-N-acetylmuramoyl-tripeptide--D-alanyl-D-alanine ligase
MEIFLDKVYMFLAQLYLAKGRHQTVVVTGSVGKTSTTQAIATVLSESFAVKTTRHNYNTHRGVPLSVFDLDIPTSRVGWLGVTARAMTKAIFGTPKFDMLVLELGSDKPGDVAKFVFLHPDIAVVTAVTPEHMEYFKTIDAVAMEELSVAKYSAKILVNSTLVAQKYISKYAIGTSVVKYCTDTNNAVESVEDVVLKIDDTMLKLANPKVVSVSGATALLVAANVAKQLGMDELNILDGLAKVSPVAGRMSRLAGKNGSIIIDDTYNSSPEAVSVALDYIYRLSAKQKIVVLGNMNEMGDMSEGLHTKVGSWCDPGQIDLLVTIGPDANRYMAAAAEQKGCKVVRVDTPYQAGELVEPMLAPGTVVLAKGSQNNVYLEEAVKYWLADPEDESRLTRQHTYWPAKKAKCFGL